MLLVDIHPAGDEEERAELPQQWVGVAAGGLAPPVPGVVPASPSPT